MAGKTATAPKAEKTALQDGDVIRFDYTLWVDGKLIDTSKEDVAKGAGIGREGKRYTPLTVTLGSHHIIPGLESHIRSHGVVGTTVNVDIAAEDAYGTRDPSKIKDIPMAQFKAQKVAPQLGMSITLQGQRGTVTRVAGGRVRVDLNHDLAGKALKYEYTVTERITDAKGKVEAVLGSLFPPNSYKFTLSDSDVTLEVPDQVKFDQQWTMAKFTVVSRLREAAGKDRAVKLVETFPAINDEPEGHEGHMHGADHQH